MPERPTLTATARDGTIPTQRVTSRRFQGLVRQRIILCCAGPSNQPNLRRIRRRRRDRLQTHPSLTI